MTNRLEQFITDTDKPPTHNDGAEVFPTQNLSQEIRSKLYAGNLFNGDTTPAQKRHPAPVHRMSMMLKDVAVQAEDDQRQAAHRDDQKNIYKETYSPSLQQELDDEIDFKIYKYSQH